MPLGIKVLLTLVAGATLALLAQIAVLGESFLPGFDAIDRQGAERELRQVRLALQAEVEKIEAFGLDWAGWDESYLFLANPSGELPQADLVYASLASEAIDLFGLYDPKGDLHWAGVSDRHIEGQSEASAVLSRLAKTDLPLRARALPERLAGILNSDAGPIMIAAFPVVPHQTGHPPLGKLVVGRLLDSDLLARLAGKTGLAFVLSAVPEAARTDPGEPDAGPTYEAGEGRRRISSILPDALGERGFSLALELPGGALDLGRAALGRGVLALAVIAVVLVVFCFLLIQFSVLRPLARLAHRLIMLVHEERWSARLNLRRGDALGLVADEVDGLLERLEGFEVQGAEGRRRASPFLAISEPGAADENGEAGGKKGVP